MEAIKRIEEIKKKRQDQFIMNRLQVGTDNRTTADLKEIRDFMHLIKAPHAKNPELEHLHEVASRRLEELKLSKESMVHLRKSKALKRREKVEVTMEESADEEQAVQTTELVAEEN